jgi:N-acetylmuramoyl-L-alanine amidase
MKSYKIGIDPGHGGRDRFNVGPTGYVEADGVLNMSFHCADELTKAGHTVLMSRKKDETLSITQREQFFDNNDVDFVLSIHTNAVGDPRVRGIETIHSVFKTLGKPLAETICKQLKKDLNLPVRRVFSYDNPKTPELDDYYGMIRETNAPCVIVEVEFHSNPDAERLLKDPEFQEKAGRSIAKGFLKFAESLEV